MSSIVRLSVNVVEGSSAHEPSPCAHRHVVIVLGCDKSSESIPFRMHGVRMECSYLAKRTDAGVSASAVLALLQH